MIGPAGEAGTALTVVPTREFVFVLDPSCIEALSRRHLFRITTVLKSLVPVISIRLLVPVYFGNPAEVEIIRRTGPPLEFIGEPIGSGRFAVSKEMRSKDRGRLVPKTVDAQRALALLALSEATKADALVTDNQALLTTRYSLLGYHRVRIVPVEESLEWAQSIGIGHGVFLSASDPEARIPPAIYYPWTHPKSRLIRDWFFKRPAGSLDKTLFELIRGAILNRYSFLLYTRDLLRYYELQSEYFARRGMKGAFALQVGLFISSFYLHLWGMLDHLTTIARQAFSLTLDERRCGIMSKEFWQLVAVREPALRKIVKATRPAQWISHMSDVRHPAAHTGMLLPSSVVEDTPESLKSHVEIAEILRKEDPTLFEIGDDEFLEVMLPLMIDDWRHRNRKTVADNVIYVPDKNYFRPAVNSLDYDLAMVTGMMDIFLFAIFRKQPARPL